MNPQTPHIPGMGTAADTLDFVKNLWGGMSVPGMSLPGLGAPSLSTDDLDKKIADLKAVEAWLNVNMTMLRGTVQALEVQRATITTLKSMGASLADAMKQPGAGEPSAPAASPFASAFFAQPAAPETAEAQPKAAAPFMPNPALWWNVLQDQFKQAVSSAMSPDAVARAGAMAQEAASLMGAAAPKPAAKSDPGAARAKTAPKSRAKPKSGPR